MHVHMYVHFMNWLNFYVSYSAHFPGWKKEKESTSTCWSHPCICTYLRRFAIAGKKFIAPIYHLFLRLLCIPVLRERAFTCYVCPFYTHLLIYAERSSIVVTYGPINRWTMRRSEITDIFCTLSSQSEFRLYLVVHWQMNEAYIPRVRSVRRRI